MVKYYVGYSSETCELHWYDSVTVKAFRQVEYDDSLKYPHYFEVDLEGGTECLDTCIIIESENPINFYPV